MLYYDTTHMRVCAEEAVQEPDIDGMYDDTENMPFILRDTATREACSVPLLRLAQEIHLDILDHTEYLLQDLSD